MQQPLKNESGETWMTLKEWSGRSGVTKTDRFTSTTPEWRISWTVTGGDPDPLGLINVSVRRPDGQLITQALNLGQRTATGSFNVKTADECYLEIVSDERTWRLSVEVPARR